MIYKVVSKGNFVIDVEVVIRVYSGAIIRYMSKYGLYLLDFNTDSSETIYYIDVDFVFGGVEYNERIGVVRQFIRDKNLDAVIL